MILFFSFIGAFLTVLVVNFWATKLCGGFSWIGMLITFFVSFATIFLIATFAPEAMFDTANYVYLGFIALSLIVFWITGI